MTGQPSRRAHARYPCSLAVQVQISSLRKSADGTLLDIGMGGALLRVRGALDERPLQLQVFYEKKAFVLEARVARRAGKDPKDSVYNLYGLNFVLDMETQTYLKFLVDRLRASVQFGPKISRDYWNL